MHIRYSRARGVHRAVFCAGGRVFAESGENKGRAIRAAKSTIKRIRKLMAADALAARAKGDA